MNRRTLHANLSTARALSRSGFKLERTRSGVQSWRRSNGDLVALFGRGEKCLCWTRAGGQFAASSLREALARMRGTP